MRLSDVFDKYKHLDHLLSDSGWLPDSIQGQIVYDLWQAIKAVQESHAETRKLPRCNATWRSALSTMLQALLTLAKTKNTPTSTSSKLCARR